MSTSVPGVAMLTIKEYRACFSHAPRCGRLFHHPIVGNTATCPRAARSAAVPLHTSEWTEPSVTRDRAAYPLAGFSKAGRCIIFVPIVSVDAIHKGGFQRPLDREAKPE